MELAYRKFKDIDLSDPFFNSLKADYAEFPAWFKKKAEDRAYVFLGDSGAIDGFLYLKIEDGPLKDVSPALPPRRRIKVGTLKINPHGTRLGERFLKKIFDHALHAGIREIYVTVFAKHAKLLELFERYGFAQRAEKVTQNGTELVLVRDFDIAANDVVTRYPLVDTTRAGSYLLSLYPKWHTRLLPDSILATETADVIGDVSHTNSIHKVYLTAMRGIERLRQGDVLVIYRTSDQQGSARYRSVATSICVVEEYRNINSFSSLADFMRYCKPYSVFTDQELTEFWQRKKYPHIIRFTYNVALKKRPTRAVLVDEVGLVEDEYWGFMEISKDQFRQIVSKGQINESLIVG